MRLLVAVVFSFAALAASSEDGELEKLEIVRAKSMTAQEQKDAAKAILKGMKEKDQAAREKTLQEIAGMAGVGFFLTDDGVLKDEHIQRLRKIEPFLKEIFNKQDDVLKFIEGYKVPEDDEDQKKDVVEGIKLLRGYYDTMKKAPK